MRAYLARISPRRRRAPALPACAAAGCSGALNARLEYVGRDPGRLIALLELSDEDLLQALGGAELKELQARYGLHPMRMPTADGVQRICRHDPGYPAALAQGPGAPRVLHVAGGRTRLAELLGEPAVAIVGARVASDYGMEVAYGLARGLAASGVTVLSGLAEGIAAAAHAGALAVGGPTVTVMAGGMDICRPGQPSSPSIGACASGCMLAELPCGCRPRSWYETARSRIVVALARS